MVAKNWNKFCNSISAIYQHSILVSSLSFKIQKQNSNSRKNTGYNKIEDEGLQYLCESLASNTSLTELILSFLVLNIYFQFLNSDFDSKNEIGHNRISDQGCKFLEEILKNQNKTLRKLVLSLNNLFMFLNPFLWKIINFERQESDRQGWLFVICKSFGNQFIIDQFGFRKQQAWRRRNPEFVKQLENKQFLAKIEYRFHKLLLFF